jgi:hypothetical protein
MLGRSMSKLKHMDPKVVLDATKSFENLLEWVNRLRKKQKPRKKSTKATEKQQKTLVEPKGKKQKRDGPIEKPKQREVNKDRV